MKKPAKPTYLPLADRIIVTDPLDAAKTNTNEHGEQVIGGIVVPASSSPSSLPGNKQPTHYVVTALAVGPACKTVATGDRIVVTSSGLFRVDAAGVKFCAVMEGNVIAVV